MRILIPAVLAMLLNPIASHASPLLITGGCWWTDPGFVCEDRWIEDGVFITQPDVDVAHLDVTGRYLIPPYGEAHNHNLAEARAPMFSDKYLSKGIFYVQVPGNFLGARAKAEASLSEPRVDASYANGLFTAPGGHPWGLVRRNENRGIFEVGTAEGSFVHSVVDGQDIDRVWQTYINGEPDFLKLVLMFSDAQEDRAGHPEHFSWYGINPGLVPLLVAHAHAAQLQVMAHVETAADFRVAVRAGVDQIGHIPGFRLTAVPGDILTSTYRLSIEDAEAASKAGTKVITTIGALTDALLSDPTIVNREVTLELLESNVRTLLAAGVPLAFGSDNYGGDSSQEARAMLRAEWMDVSSIIHTWSVVTPQTIFPDRRLGCLDPGCEADFIGLAADPRQDADALFTPILLVKGGVLIGEDGAIGG